MKDIIQRLQEHCTTKGSAVAFSHITDINIEGNNISNAQVDVTYDQLLSKIKNTALLLSEKYNKGDRVLLIYPSGIDFVVAILACFYTGVIAVPCHKPNPKRTGDKVHAIIENCKPSGILTNEQYYHFLARTMKEIPLVKITGEHMDLPSEQTACSLKCTEINGDDIALLQYTSGSTSDPKGVIVTRKNISSMCEFIDYYQKVQDTDKSITWLPNFHDMGLIEGLLKHLYMGTQCFIISTQELFIKPQLWLYFMSKYRINLSGAPNFLFEKCLDDTVVTDRLDLSCISVLYNGAEPIRYKTISQFYKKFSKVGLKVNALYTVYGLAEATLLVTGKTREDVSKVIAYNDTLENNVLISLDEPDCEYKHAIVSCGEINRKYCDVVVLASENKQCEENQIGEIYIKGDSVTPGYWNNAVETEQAYNHYINNDGPYLKTGDLGFIREGQLFITGRSKDIFITNGKNIYPQDIEFTIGEVHPSIEASGIAVFATDNADHEIVAAIELKHHYKNVDYDALADEIHRRIVAEHLIELNVVSFIRTYSLPKTSSGKIQRSRCKTMYVDKQMKVLFQKTYQRDANRDLIDSIEIVLDQIISADEQVSYSADLEKSFLELGVDSIQLIQIAHKINDKYHLDYALEDFLDGRNILQLARDIRSKTEANDMRSDEPELRDGPRDNFFPISIGQKSLVVIQNSQPEHGLLNIGRIIKLKGQVRKSDILEILNKLANCFELLSAKMVFSGSELIFTFDRDFDQDVSILQDDTRPVYSIADRLTDEFYRPFDLMNQHLFRIHIAYDETGYTFLSFSFHHIIADLWSLTLFMDAFFSLLKEPQIHIAANIGLEYRHYVAKTNRLLESNQYADKMEGFRAFIQDKWALADIDFLYKKDHINDTYTGNSERITLSPVVSDRIHRCCQENQLTQYTFLFAVFELLMHLYTGQDEVIIGSTYAGRDKKDYSSTFGFFTNLFPVQTEDLNQIVTVKQFLQCVKDKIMGHLRYSNIHLSELVRNLHLTEKANNYSVFNVVFSFQNTIRLNNHNYASVALSKSESITLYDFELEFIDLAKRYTLFDIDFQMVFNGTFIEGDVVYNADLIDNKTIQTMVSHYKLLLEKVIEDCNANITDLDLLDACQKETVFAEINQSYQGNYQVSDGLLSKFGRIVNHSPDAVAVIDRENHISYAAMNVLSNRLANRMKTHSESVGVMVGRNVYYPASLLAALKKGKGIVPIDPDMPLNRQQHIVNECNIDQFIVEREYVPRVEALLSNHSGSYLVCDEVYYNPELECDNEIIPTKSLDNYVYTVFTSGSTGMPKGVSIRERNIIPLFEWQETYHNMARDTRLIQCLSLGFDFGIQEIIATIFYGCRLYFVEPYVPLNPEEFALYNDKFYINIFYMTPSMASNIVKHGKRLNHVRRILLGGEMLSIELTKALRGILDEECIITNGYGPTEASINCLMFDVHRGVNLDALPGHSIPVGSSTGTAKLIVVDKKHRLVTPGIVGELCICGTCVSDGYINNPELTSEKFPTLDSVFGTNYFGSKRMYLTGDKACEISPGQYEFLGRDDSQVKIRGFRIELNEITNALKKHPSIKDAVVDVEGKGTEQMITAYLVTDSQSLASSDQQRSYLEDQLPYYMIPGEFYLIDSIPLSGNGKLDYSKLKNIKTSKLERVHTPKKYAEDNETKKIIFTIWKAALQDDRFSYDDNFFDIGGHSLQIIDIHKQLETHFGNKIPFSKLFELPTINLLAEYISNVASGDEGITVPGEYDQQIRNRKQLREQNWKRTRGG